MQFKRAVARKPGEDFCNGLTEAGLGEPDYALALVQHGRYIETLRSLGVSVEILPVAEGYPDGCFVEDTAIVVDEAIVLTRPGAHSRRGEVDSIGLAFTKYRKEIVRITNASAAIEGGDVLLIGRDFYVGMSKRTNEIGMKELENGLGRFGYTVTPVHFNEAIHLKSNVTAIGDDMVFINEDLKDHPAFAKYKKVIVPAGEEYAANTLLVNGKLIIADNMPKSAERLKAAGCDVLALDMSEYRKMDGALTCLSLRFN